MKLTKNARELRKRQTETEAFLWQQLRAKRFLGLKFRRQHPIGKYIVDFVCYDKHLVIEVDGSQHLIQTSYDKKRDRFLNSEGFKVLRFSSVQIFESKSEVLELIAQNCV